MNAEGRIHARVRSILITTLILHGGTALAAGDAGRGSQVFKGTCAVCHPALPKVSRADQATKLGPNLFGVVGRKAGTLPGFRYSAAMRASGLTWTEEQLRQYIQAPQKMIPDVRMSFPGLPNAKDAEDVLAYLTTLK